MTGSILQDQTISQKAEALLSEMNLDQKVGQMTQPERMSLTPEDVMQYHLGGVLSGAGSSPGSNLPADWVAMNDAFWAASMTQDARHMAIPSHIWRRCHSRQLQRPGCDPVSTQYWAGRCQ